MNETTVILIVGLCIIICFCFIIGFVILSKDIEQVNKIEKQEETYMSSIEYALTKEGELDNMKLLDCGISADFEKWIADYIDNKNREIRQTYTKQEIKELRMKWFNK